MDTVGMLRPADPSTARERFSELGQAAETVVAESAKAMEFDREELEARVTPTVVNTAHEALFASLLTVQVGTADEFESWREDTDRTVTVLGSEHVDHVAWHAPAFETTAVAATFQNEREAAIATLRRHVFGRCYQEVVT